MKHVKKKICCLNTHTLYRCVCVCSMSCIICTGRKHNYFKNGIKYADESNCFEVNKI